MSIRALNCGVECVGLSLHPSSTHAAVGLIDGSVQIWDYAAEDGGKEDKFKRVEEILQEDEKSSCRVVKYTDDGSYLFTGTGKHIRCFDRQGSLVWEQPDAHPGAINCLYCINGEDGVFVSGDEEGEIKLWDIRKGTDPLTVSKEHSDYIADMICCPEKKTLLTAAGDGRLGVYQMKMGFRKAVFKELSDEQDDDLLSLQIMYGGKKVIAGTQEGVLDIWNWGEWGDISDRFPGHPYSVEALLKWDETTMITGSSDGLIRVVNLFPNKLLGVIGDHKELPIERLAWSHDRQYVASVSHDSFVRFWDTSILHDEDDDEEEQEQEQEAVKNSEAKQEENSSDDEDDSSDEEQTKKKKKKKKKPVAKQEKPKYRNRPTKRAKTEAFYSDL